VSERPDTPDLGTRHQARLRRVSQRYDDPLEPRPHRREDSRQDAADLPHAAVEAQLAEHDHRRELGVGQLAVSGEDRGGEREVEAASALRQCRRRQAHRYPSLRPHQAGVDDRGADPVARFPQRGVRQADERHRRDAVRQVRLDLHQVALDADQGDAPGLGDGHQSAPRRWVTCAGPERGVSTLSTSNRMSA
jgi:hypothetical protein